MRYANAQLPFEFNLLAISLPGVFSSCVLTRLLKNVRDADVHEQSRRYATAETPAMQMAKTVEAVTQVKKASATQLVKKVQFPFLAICIAALLGICVIQQ